METENEKRCDESNKQIRKLAEEISYLYPVPGKIKSIAYAGEFHPLYFPIEGLIARDEEMYQVKKNHSAVI